MSMTKQAAEAVNMLMDEGVDFDMATDLVMEKVAGTTSDIYWHGQSKAEQNLADSRGYEAPKRNTIQRAGHNMSSALPTLGKSMGGGVLGAFAGSGAVHLAGKLTKSKVGVLARLAGGSLGSTAGAIGGSISSHKNRAKALEDKYPVKQASAAVNMLMDEGIDFDTAADLVMEKVAFLDAVAGAVASTPGHRWGGAGVGMLGGFAGGAIGARMGGPSGYVTGAIAGGAAAGHLYGKHATAKDNAKIAKKIGDDYAAFKAQHPHFKIPQD